jgi:uncharacterized PurR-regulated membrane protein YhhQ (DUF165 family)
MRRAVAFAAFVSCVIGANWALDAFGFVDPPLLGPVPAGVVFAGLAFGARDVLHETGGARVTLFAISVGAVVSWWIEPSFAVASGVAVGVSEMADFAVYAPLRRRRWAAAVVASNVVGSALDSALFLWLAFGPVTGWVDLTIGKAVMTVPALVAVWAVRR